MVNIRSKRDSLTGFYTYVIHNPNTNQVLRWELKNNGDLLWKYISPNQGSEHYEVFTVDKSDHELHSIIDRLYNEIKNGQIFVNDISVNIDFRKANRGNNVKFAASEMYDPNTNMVKWYSDDDNTISSVFINKNGENYQLIFVSDERKKSTDIVFKQNDSFYECGAIPFLRAHNRLEKLITKQDEKENEKIYTFKKSA